MIVILFSKRLLPGVKRQQSKGEKWPEGVRFYPSGLRKLQVTGIQSEGLVNLGMTSKVKSQVQYCSDLVQMCGIPISKKGNMTLILTEWNSECGRQETLPKSQQAKERVA